MRRNIKIPRILKINWIKDLSISVVFNNGESRTIDFKKVFKKLDIDDNFPAGILINPVEFANVKIIDNALSWSNVEQYITGKDRKKKIVPFEIGADIY